MRVDDCRGVADIEVRLAPDCADPTVRGNDRVGVEDWPLKIAAEHQADIADHQLRRTAPGLGFETRHGSTSLRNSSRHCSSDRADLQDPEMALVGRPGDLAWLPDGSPGRLPQVSEFSSFPPQSEILPAARQLPT